MANLAILFLLLDFLQNERITIFGEKKYNNDKKNTHLHNFSHLNDLMSGKKRNNC